MLLREEMRRVLESLEFKASWWDNKYDARRSATDELREGISAYATEQASLQHALAAAFKEMWKTPLAQVDELLTGLETLQHAIDNHDNDSDDSSDDSGDDSSDDSSEEDEQEDIDIDSE